MARGGPDYGTLDTETVIKDIDEISVDISRTGFSRMDGGGRVVWFDDFSMGLSRVSVFGTGGGATPVPVMENDRAFGLSPSLKLDPVVNTGQSIVGQIVPLPLSGKLGLEFGYYMPVDHGSLTVVFAPFITYGLHEGFLLNYHQSTDEISLYVDSGYQAIYTPLTTDYTQDRRLQIKMVVNPETQKYERVFFGTSKISTPYNGRSNYIGGDVGGAFFQFIYKGEGASNKTPFYLGYVLISADEP